MQQEHAIVAAVYAAKDDTHAADQLVRQYLPFIKAETAKFTHRIPREGEDDELSIAMFAFHEAVLAYDRGRGTFLRFAATAIRSRLIDYQRREQRHSDLISLDQAAGDSGDDRTLLEQLDSGRDEIAARQERSVTQAEILEFAVQLADFGLKLTDIADNCPRQERTLSACHRALAYAKEHPVLLEQLLQSRKVPIGPLAEGAGVERKTLERHRKYLVAILLAYTNGYQIIRGHLQQIAPRKGGETV